MRAAGGVISRVLRTTRLATAVLILPGSGMAHATTWQSSLALPMTVESDTNPRLEEARKKTVTRSIIAPDLRVQGTDDNDQWLIGLGANLERSSDESTLQNREDPRLELGWQRATETAGYGLMAKYIESSTLSSTVQDTGVVTADGTQTQYSLAVNWSRALSERSTLSNESEFSDFSYDTDELTDYQELSTRMSLVYAWSERVNVFSRLSARHYAPEQGLEETSSANSYTPTAGLSFELTEQFGGTLFAGVSQSTGQDSSTRGEGGMELHYLGERFETRVDAERTTVASGEGGFAKADRLNGSWSYLIDDTRRTGVDASWQKTAGQTPNKRREYGAWVSQDLSSFWAARLYLMHREREQESLPDTSANIIGVTLTYSHPDL